MGNPADLADDEIRQAFIEDGKQLLEDAEDAFISLSEGTFSTQLLDKIMRLAHNFKGSARAVGFTSLAEFAHHMEDALILLQKRQIKPDSYYSSILLKALDELKIITHGLSKDFTFQHDTTAIEEKLKSLSTYIDQISATPENQLLPEGETKKNNEQLKLVENPKPSPQTSPQVSEDQRKLDPPNPKIELIPTAPENRALPRPDETVRVSAKKLDSLLDLIGELVVNQDILSEYFRNHVSPNDPIVRAIDSMKKETSEMRDIALTFRMTPVSPLFRKMRRAVRDLASSLSKEIDFQTLGEDVELDKTVVEQMGDPLTHLVRNAVDHGIESKEQREKTGKPPVARIRLSAEQRNDQVAIIISDDGKGMDKNIIKNKAIEKGLISAKDKLTDDQIYRLIFLPGFSTKEVTTDVSGRGVGMDVVQKAVEHLKGKIEIITQLGKGTTFEVILPLSLSIIPGMVIRLGEDRYTVPITQMLETLDFKKIQHEKSMGENQVVNLRGEIFPIFSLSQILKKASASPKTPIDSCAGIVVVSKGKKVVFAVDELLYQQQVVIKKLGTKLKDLPGIAGGTILSNGDPSLVLDLQELIDRIGRVHAA